MIMVLLFLRIMNVEKGIRNKKMKKYARIEPLFTFLIPFSTFLILFLFFGFLFQYY